MRGVFSGGEMRRGGKEDKSFIQGKLVRIMNLLFPFPFPSGMKFFTISKNLSIAGGAQASKLQASSFVQSIQEAAGQLGHHALVRQAARDAVQGRHIPLGASLGAFALDRTHPLLFFFLVQRGDEIVHEPIERRDDRDGERDVHGGRVLEGVQRPALGRHGVRDVVDVEGLGREGHNADERVSQDAQIAAERGMLADGGFEFLGRADDGMACRYVSIFALRHQTCPATGDQRAWTGTGYAGRGIHAARPVCRDEILVGAEGGGSVE